MVFSMRDSVALINKTPIFIALTRSSMSSKNFFVVNSPWFTTYQVKSLPLFTTLLVNSRCYTLMESLRVQKSTECFYKLLLYEESPLFRSYHDYGNILYFSRFIFHIPFSFPNSDILRPTHLFIPRIRSSFLLYITFPFPHFSSIIPPYWKKLGISTRSMSPHKT